MLQYLRNGLMPLLVSACFGAAGCSPAPRPPIERSSDVSPESPKKERVAARSSSSAGDAPGARPGGPQAVSDAGTPTADGGVDVSRAASIAQVVADGGALPTDAGPRPTNEGSANAAEDDPEAETFTVPDCQGGKTIAPIWLRRVPFWEALCVHGLPKKPLRVDVGTSLVMHAELNSGDAVNIYQVYYALDQIRVPAGEKRLIWAMCGGGGDWLSSGTRVIPTHRLPAVKSRLIAEHVETLKAINYDLGMSKQSFRFAPTPALKNYYKGKVDQLDAALTDAAGLLRDAIIKENRVLLSRSSGTGGQGPPVFPNPTRPPGTGGQGHSVIPPPIIN